jgi:hypothetical protein
LGSVAVPGDQLRFETKEERENFALEVHAHRPLYFLFEHDLSENRYPLFRIMLQSVDGDEIDPDPPVLPRARGKVEHDAFAVIREIIREMDQAAIGQVVLNNREHIPDLMSDPQQGRDSRNDRCIQAEQSLAVVVLR